MVVDRMSDPHIICSQGARNCSNCFSLCTDEQPCMCCGGDDDAPEWEDVAEAVDESPDFLAAEVERLTADLGLSLTQIGEALRAMGEALPPHWDDPDDGALEGPIGLTP